MTTNEPQPTFFYIVPEAIPTVQEQQRLLNDIDKSASKAIQEYQEKSAKAIAEQFINFKTPSSLPTAPEPPNLPPLPKSLGKLKNLKSFDAKKLALLKAKALLPFYIPLPDLPLDPASATQTLNNLPNPNKDLVNSVKSSSDNVVLGVKQIEELRDQYKKQVNEKFASYNVFNQIAYSLQQTRLSGSYVGI